MSEEPQERREQDPEAQPIVEDARLPLMAGADEAPHELRESAERMAVEPPEYVGGERQMEPYPPDPAQRQPPHEQRSRERSVEEGGESYVRLTIHNEQGDLTVVAVREIEGPLASPSALPAGFSWEVASGDRRVSMGSIPDAGIVRSFANRDVPEPEGRHGFQEVSSFDFNVRIPRNELTPNVLPSLRVSLHRIRRVTDRGLGAAPLRLQLSESELVEVGHLDGLRRERIAEPARLELERMLRTHL